MFITWRRCFHCKVRVFSVAWFTQQSSETFVYFVEQRMTGYPSMIVSVCVCVRACVGACVRVCVRACVRSCVCLCVCDAMNCINTVYHQKSYWFGCVCIPRTMLSRFIHDVLEEMTKKPRETSSACVAGVGEGIALATHGQRCDHQTPASFRCRLSERAPSE